VGRGGEEGAFLLLVRGLRFSAFPSTRHGRFLVATKETSRASSLPTLQPERVVCEGASSAGCVFGVLFFETLSRCRQTQPGGERAREGAGSTPRPPLAV